MYEQHKVVDAMRCTFFSLTYLYKCIIGIGTMMKNICGGYSACDAIKLLKLFSQFC